MGKFLIALVYLLEKPYRMLFLLCSVFLFFGLASVHSSYEVKKYTETEGEICNLTSEEVLRHGKSVTRYDYDLVWYADGQEYQKHLNGQTDMPAEGITSIWVRPDNGDAVLFPSVEIKRDAVIYLGVAMGTGLLGMVIYICYLVNRKETDEEKRDRLETAKVGSMIVFCLSLIAAGIGFWVYCGGRKDRYTNSVMLDFSLYCGMIALISIICFINAGHKVKQMM